MDMAVSNEVVLAESQIFTQRKTNFKNKKHTILTMIIFCPSHVFTSHFVAQSKSFMKPKLGYLYEYNILYAKPTFRQLFFSGKNEQNISKFCIILMLYASTFIFCCLHVQNLYPIPGTGTRS